MTARPQRTAADLLTSGLDACLDRTHHHHDPSESSPLPERDDRFLVNAAFVRDPTLRRECSSTQQLTDPPPPIERLYWMAEQRPGRQAAEAGISPVVIHDAPSRSQD
jgi:hypothetical protein